MNQLAQSRLEQIISSPFATDLQIGEFCFSLVMTIVLSSILAWIYRICGRTLSNKEAFAGNFVMVAATTMIIISIVKSSLALSLGLVGALSIVRFRTAIKEPEELAYLFLCITIGLGMGANQIAPTCIGFFILCAILVTRHMTNRGPLARRQIIDLNCESGIDLGEVSRLLTADLPTASMRRYDELDGGVEIIYEVEIESLEQFAEIKDKLKMNQGIRSISVFSE